MEARGAGEPATVQISADEFRELVEYPTQIAKSEAALWRERNHAADATKEVDKLINGSVVKVSAKPTD